MPKPGLIPNALRSWIEARKRFRLSDATVQIARELGLDPKALGKIANHDQEKWKAPLPEFIARLYLKRFGEHSPDAVRSIEQLAAAKQAKKQMRRAVKARAAGADSASASD
jgi:hypothetical protein